MKRGVTDQGNRIPVSATQTMAVMLASDLCPLPTVFIESGKSGCAASVSGRGGPMGCRRFFQYKTAKPTVKRIRSGQAKKSADTATMNR